MKKTLLLGYGNPDRGDDGIAWHILNKLLEDKDIFEEQDDLLNADLTHLDENVDIWFNLQLLPEVSELLAKYEKAIFIDAHTSEIQNDINIETVEPLYLNSPFTHHVTPSTCLALAEAISGKYPKSWLLSIRGYEFKFERDLTLKTKEIAGKALKLLKEKFLE